MSGLFFFYHSKNDMARLSQRVTAILETGPKGLLLLSPTYQPDGY